jgi:hypothetical protein
MTTQKSSILQEKKTDIQATFLFIANEIFEISFNSSNSLFATKRKVSCISAFCFSCKIDVFLGCPLFTK